jgi:ribosomal protein S26
MCLMFWKRALATIADYRIPKTVFGFQFGVHLWVFFEIVRATQKQYRVRARAARNVSVRVVPGFA